jgi:AcrR family transcriptional regulator
MNTAVSATIREVNPAVASETGNASDGAVPPEGSDQGAETRRRYDSPVRRERAAATRQRILAAGSELVHEFTTWDWRGLTFRAVAERAGVGERTVYRYFATERELHDAIMRRLGEESGINYDDLSLETMGTITERLFASLPSYAVARWGGELEVTEPVLVAEDVRRREAVVAAMAKPAAEWTEQERRMAAGMLDLLWSVPSYQRLVAVWGLDGDHATRAITWAIGVIADAVREGRRPATAGDAQPEEGDAVA